MVKVIVFGASGGVGSVTAKTARQHGAEVVLAMRDISKSIPDLTVEEESRGGYQRIKADLCQPETVAEAVKSTGATRAYFYNAPGSLDNMEGAIDAMKLSGITFAVFLSTATITDSPDDIEPGFSIPYLHAQVEKVLGNVFGAGNWVAVRPGAFASNLIGWHVEDTKAGTIGLHYPDYKFDNITPDDIGSVSGVLLADGPRNEQQVVYLHGPEATSQQESIARINCVTGRNLQTRELSTEEHVSKMGKIMPPALAEWMTGMLSAPEAGMEYLKHHAEGRENVKLYTGRAATTLDEFIAKNKQAFV